MKFVNIRLWLFLFGIIFVIAAYLFQQSRTNQKQLRQQAMKSIENTRINFQEAFDNHHLQLDSYLKRSFYSLSQIEGAHTAKKMTKEFDRAERFPVQQIRLITHSDSLFKYNRLKNLQIISLDSSFILESDYLFNFNVVNRENFIQLKKLIDTLDNQPNWKLLQDSLYLDRPLYFGITHLISFYDLMKYNLNNKFFDRTYVVDEEGKILYPQAQAGLMLFEPAELYSESTDPDGNMLMKLGNRNIRLQINAEDHEVFITPVNVGDTYLYLAGAKELNRFQKVALRIDYSLLSAFVIVLLLIFTSIPIFSMIKLDVGDVLSKNKIFGLGLSLILLSLILGFTVAFIRNSINEDDQKEQLMNIEESYISNIDQYNLHLENFPYKGQICTDTTCKLSNIPLSIHQKVNEYLKFNEDFLVTKMIFPNIGSSSSLDLTFDSLQFISLANRDYAQYIFKNDSSSKFISAHYSLATGELEGVISHKNNGENGKAITFKLSAIAENESQSNRFFIFKPDGKILFKSEKVTVPVSYLQQAVEHLKWVEIKSLIINNEDIAPPLEWEIPLYVNGYEYLGVLKKLSFNGYDEDLWMLYLIDENIQHVRSSLISLESVMFIIGYIILLIFLAFLTSIANKKSIYLNYKSFSYSWYAPSANKRKQFLLLNFLILFEIVCLLMLYNLIPMNIFILFLWCSFFAIQTSIIKFLLLHPDKEGPYDMDEINYLTVMTLFWLLFASFLIYTVYISAIDLWVTIITGLSIIIWGSIIGYSFYKMSNMELPKFDPLSVPKYKFDWQSSTHRKMTKAWDKITQSTAPIRIYALSFVLWSIMIGFLPGYMLPREVHSHETQIWKAIQTDHTDTSPIALTASFQHLIEKYEYIRRYAFTQLSDQHDQVVSDFINLNQIVLFDAFSGSKNRNYAAVLFFSLIMILVFWLLFKLIMYLCHRIFLTEFLYDLEKSVHPVNSKIARNNFIVCTDNQKAKEWIFDHDELVGIKPTVLNLARLSPQSGQEDWDKLTEKGRVVIMENIHVKAQDFGLVELLSDILEKASEFAHIFIISGMPFKELEKTMSNSDALYFSELLSSFIFHTVPIHYNLPTKNIGFKNQYKRLPNNNLLKILNQEINYGPNAEQIWQLISREVQIDDENFLLTQERFEKCILTIQRFNKAYFSNIWHELSFKEKKLVYYFAKEGFTNFRNKESLTTLIEKGVFILNKEKNKLVLFSLSFQNYVSQNISLELKSAFKKDEREYGNAGNIQSAAISFIFISLAVVSYYDPTILNKTSAYVSAVIGLMGTIYSVFSRGITFLTDKAKVKE